MNKEEVMKLAREAGLLPLLDEDCFQAMGSKNFDATKKVLERFVTLVLAQRKPLSDEMQKQMKEQRCDSMEMRSAFIDGWLSAEAAHGIGEKHD